MYFSWFVDKPWWHSLVRVSLSSYTACIGPLYRILNMNYSLFVNSEHSEGLIIFYLFYTPVPLLLWLDKNNWNKANFKGASFCCYLKEGSYIAWIMKHVIRGNMLDFQTLKVLQLQSCLNFFLQWMRIFSKGCRLRGRESKREHSSIQQSKFLLC